MKSWAGKRACVVITTDDGWLPTLENLYDLSIDFPSIRTTNYIVTGSESEFANNENWASYKDRPQIIRDLINRGHEIGSHTHNHYYVDSLTDAQLTSEMSQSYSELERLNVPKPYTVGYPYGSSPLASKYPLIQPYYTLGRDTAQQESLIFLNGTQIDETSTRSPYDNFKVSCRNGGWDYNVESAAAWLTRMKSYVNDAIDNNACVFILWHYIDENTRTGYGTIKTSMIREFYEYLASVQDSVWFPTAKQFQKFYSSNTSDSIPIPVSNVQVTTLNATTNKVTWNHSTESDVVDYILHANGIEVGRTYHNEFTHLKDNDGKNYIYEVKALNVHGRLSGTKTFDGVLKESNISSMKFDNRLNETKLRLVKVGNTVRYIDNVYIKK